MPKGPETWSKTLAERWLESVCRGFIFFCKTVIRDYFVLKERIALALRAIRTSPTKAPGGPVVIRVATGNHQLQSFWKAPRLTMAINARNTTPCVNPKIRTNSSSSLKEAMSSTIRRTKSITEIHRTIINQRSTFLASKADCILTTVVLWFV